MPGFVGRDKQLTTLSNAIDNSINANLLVIHGPPASGKSLVLNHVLQHKHINYVYMSCRFVCTVKQFFDILLNEIHDKFNPKQFGHHHNKENVAHRSNASNTKHTPQYTDYLGWRRHSKHKQCTSAATFAHILQNEDFSKGQSFYIILDHFQRLVEIQSDLISSLVEITEIESLFKCTQSRLGFIFLDDSSCMIHIKQLLGSKHDIAFPVAFPQYDSKQLQSILFETTKPLFNLCKLDLSESEIKLVIKQLVSSFHVESRRIDRFQQYLALLMPDILKLGASKKHSERTVTEESKEKEEMDVDEQTEMHAQNNCIVIQRMILSLHDRVSSSQHLSMDYLRNVPLDEAFADERKEPDLPYASKLLLLAAYLASYNTHKWNVEQFTDLARKRARRRKNAPKPKDEYSLREKGPQIWTLRDLTGIFIELFKRESPVEFNKDLRHIHDIHSQIAHLISLSFISVVSKQGVLDDMKFKCNIDHDFARFIAEKIKVDKWENYLEP